VSWTEKICGGSDEMFEKIACEHYTRDPSQCELLNEGRIATLCEQGRCTFAIIGIVQKTLSRQFPDLLDEREDFDLQKFTDQLKQMAWNGSRIPSRWLSYLSTAIRRLSITLLVRMRVAPDEKRCGTCANLPRWKPYTCQISGDEKRRTHPACDDYRFPGRTILREPHGVGDEDERGGSPFDGPAAEKSEAFQQTVDSKMDVESLRRELAKRAAAKDLGKRKRAAFVRQYDLVVRLHRLLGEVHSDKNIFRILAQEMSVCERTIRRDLAEIRRFLMFRFQ
jgi:hypothetical protein